MVDRENLVRKIQFPRLAIPVAVVLTAGFNLCLNLIVVLVFALASGVEVRLTWLELAAHRGLLVLLALGTAALVSALFVRFRDVKPIWDVFLQLLFYASPVDLRARDDRAARDPGAAGAQPDHRDPPADAPRGGGPERATAAAAAGGMAYLMIPIGVIVFTVVLGAWVFNREAPRIAEEL